MLRLLADENFNNQIVRGILRRRPEIDIVRVQDVDLSETDDRVILEWAAQQGRILLAHDVETMTRYAYERVQAGLELTLPGLKTRGFLNSPKLELQGRCQVAATDSA